MLSQMSDSDWTKEFAKLGLNSRQIGELFRVRREKDLRRPIEGLPEHRRLEFIRWLYQQGRLQS